MQHIIASFDSNTRRYSCCVAIITAVNTWVGTTALCCTTEIATKLCTDGGTPKRSLRKARNRVRKNQKQKKLIANRTDTQTLRQTSNRRGTNGTTKLNEEKITTEKKNYIKWKWTIALEMQRNHALLRKVTTIRKFTKKQQPANRNRDTFMRACIECLVYPLLLSSIASKKKLPFWNQRQSDRTADALCCAVPCCEHSILPQSNYRFENNSKIIKITTSQIHR